MSISANEIIEIMEKYGKKRSIAMDFKEGETELTDSKLSGVPYLPKDSQWPLDKKTGEKLVFMLQVNFSEVPKMENYPESGIMQIFIANDDISGIDELPPHTRDFSRELGGIFLNFTFAYGIISI